MWKRLDPKLPQKIRNKIENLRYKRNGRKRSEYFYSLTPRSRTDRKDTKRRRKEERARNKRLITKYPWLAPRDWRTGQPITDKRYSYISVWNEIPDGWIRAFGEQMCDEIEAALEKDNLQDKVYVEQAKEKYGQLRIYMSGNEESLHIIDIYSHISENVCCQCGRPHVPMLDTSWIGPLCRNCFDIYFDKNSTKTYEDFAPKNIEAWRISNTIKWTRFSKEGNTTTEIDISDRVKQIEQRWNERHPDDPV